MDNITYPDKCILCDEPFASVQEHLNHLHCKIYETCSACNGKAEVPVPPLQLLKRKLFKMGIDSVFEKQEIRFSIDNTYLDTHVALRLFHVSGEWAVTVYRSGLEDSVAKELLSNLTQTGTLDYLLDKLSEATWLNQEPPLTEALGSVTMTNLSTYPGHRR